MDKKDRLFHIAEPQQGYFTSSQAIECGFQRSTFHRNIRSGEWLKEQRGIYRMARYPISSDRPELVLWSLWSRNRGGEIQGVWSHETALNIYNICSIKPTKMHMTVPRAFGKRASTPSFLILHYSDLPENAIRAHQGYLITTPLRTLTDIVNEGTLSKNLVMMALREGLRQGIFFREQIETAPDANKLKVLLNEI